MDFIDWLKKQISLWQKAIRGFWILVVCFAALGIAALAISFTASTNSSEWLKLGGGIILALAGLSYSQIFFGRARVITYKTILKCYMDCEGMLGKRKEKCKATCAVFATEAMKKQM